MALKRLSSNSNLVSQLLTIDEELTVKGFAMRMADATQVLQLLPAEIGRITYSKNGKTLVDVGVDFLIALGDLMGGFSENTSVLNAELEYWIYIPRRYKNDNNVELIKPSDKAQIRITFGSDVAATMIAATEAIEIYADIDDGVQKYELEILQVSDSIGGAGNVPFNVSATNILMVLLSDSNSGVLTLAGSNIDQVTMDIGQHAFDMSTVALLSDTNYHNHFETETDLLGVVYDARGTISGKLHDNTRLKFTTSGAATPEVITIGAKFNDARSRESLKLEANKLRERITAKTAKGDTDTVLAIQRFAGRAASAG